jgi:hypothetical protein
MFWKTAVQGGFAGFGFAWAPAKPAGMDDPAFARETAAVLERLAAWMHDSFREDRAEFACGPGEARPWCACEVPCASFNGSWQTFDHWG